MTNTELLGAFSTNLSGIWKENYVLIIVAGLMLFLSIRGYKEGLVSMLVSLTSVILALVLTKRYLPVFSEQIRSTGVVDTWVDNFVQNNLTAGSADSGILYGLLGIDTVAHDAGQKMADLVIMVISFIVLFIGITIALKILSYILNRFADLPVIRTFNAVLGMALGFVESVIYTWVLMTIVVLVPLGKIGTAILTQISNSPFLDTIFQNNLILAFLRNMFGG